MKISIIIPSYNQNQYLASAISSCLEQTKKPHEIIVVDDGSTDNSLAIARSFEKEGVKVISQTNRGLSSARNTGIMNATGDYILPLDADDMFLENAIEKISQVIEQTGADIVSPSFKCFGVSQAEIILMPNPTIDDFITGNRVGYCSAIKKDVLLEVGGYSAKMWVGWEDYHLWFNLLLREKTIITIPEVLWLYRTKEYSMIHEANKHAVELWGQISKDFPQLNLKIQVNTPLPQ